MKRYVGPYQQKVSSPLRPLLARARRGVVWIENAVLLPKPRPRSPRVTRSGRRVLLLVALPMLCKLAAPSPAEAADDTPAAVVVLNDLSSDGAVEAARETMSAHWRLERLSSEKPPERAPIPEVEELSRAYLNADFLRCLTELQRSSLDLDRLLEHGRRTEAGKVGTIAAACSLGAGDEARARELVRRLLVFELDDADTLRKTT